MLGKRIQNTRPFPFLSKVRHVWYKIIHEGLGQKERRKNPFGPHGGLPSPGYLNVPGAAQFRVEQSCP